MSEDFDQRHWDRQISRLFGLYIKTTSKSVTEAANTRSRYIVGKAFERTPKADKDKITSDLMSPRPGGKTLGQLILAKRNALKSNKPRDIARAVKKLIGQRRRSVGFVKSGWIPAFQQLGTSIGKTSSVKGGKSVKKGKDKGYARPARERGGKPIDAEVVYSNQVSIAPKIGERALKDATRAEAASLKQHLEKKLRTDLSHIRI